MSRVAEHLVREEIERIKRTGDERLAIWIRESLTNAMSNADFGPDLSIIANRDTNHQRITDPSRSSRIV